MASNPEQAQPYSQMNFDESMLAPDLRFGGQGTAIDTDIKGYYEHIPFRKTQRAHHFLGYWIKLYSVWGILKGR